MKVEYHSMITVKFCLHKFCLDPMSINILLMQEIFSFIFITQNCWQQVANNKNTHATMKEEIFVITARSKN